MYQALLNSLDLDRTLTEGHDINKSGSLSANIMNSYIEEVSTVCETIQKIISRLIRKYNWSTNSNSISVSNPGWVGDVLCLIALSPNGIKKTSIFNILHLRGYTGTLEVGFFTPFNIFCFKLSPCFKL